MAQRPRATLQELRLAVDCLPRTTRIAMLQGIQRNEIVVGAYSHDGGICPMLAAHRAGGRTNFVAFAHAWDRFAFSRSRSRRARRATDRELLALRVQLEASLLEEDVPALELRQALAQHRDLVQQRHIRPPEPDADPGWRWLRLTRRRPRRPPALTAAR